MSQELERELAARKAEGREPMSLKAMEMEFKSLGYVFDRSMDSRSYARYLTGPRAGDRYPQIALHVREMDTGRSAANADARRDANYKAMIELRGKVYAVSRKHILEA